VGFPHHKHQFGAPQLIIQKRPGIVSLGPGEADLGVQKPGNGGQARFQAAFFHFIIFPGSGDCFPGVPGPEICLFDGEQGFADAFPYGELRLFDQRLGPGDIFQACIALVPGPAPVKQLPGGGNPGGPVTVSLDCRS